MAPLTRTREEVLELHRAYLNGESLYQLATRIGTSHETVRQLFIREGLPRHSPAERANHQRSQQERQVQEHRDHIIALYKQHGTIDAVLEEIELPRKLVSEVIAQIPNREAYRRRRDQQLYGREQLIADLQRARDHAGEPLSGLAYQTIAAELRLAAFDTVINFFEMEDPDQPWQAALKAAGVKSNPPRGRRPSSTSPEQCVQAVMRCIEGHGGQRVSYRTYRSWAAQNEAPSGPTVRKLMGWNAVVEEALDRLARRVP